MAASKKKNRRSSAYAANLNSLFAVLKQWMEAFWLIKWIKGSKEMVSSKGERGQSCVVPFLIFMLSKKVPLIKIFAVGEV